MGLGQQLLVPSLGVSGIDTANLVSRWKLDDGSGATAADAFGANDGTLQGNQSWSSSFPSNLSGKVTGSYDPTAKPADHIDCGATGTLDISGAQDLSIMIWANGAWESNLTLLGKWDSSMGYMMWLTTTSDSLQFRIDADATANWTSVWEASGWHHYTMTKSGTSAILYVDGVAQATKTLASATITDNAAQFEINQYADGTGAGGTGLLCDARVYTAAKSAAEILAIYNGNA